MYSFLQFIFVRLYSVLFLLTVSRFCYFVIDVASVILFSICIVSDRYWITSSALDSAPPFPLPIPLATVPTAIYES